MASQCAGFSAGWAIRDHTDDLLLWVREYAPSCVERGHSARNAAMLGEWGSNAVKKFWIFSRDHWSAGMKLHTAEMVAMLKTVEAGGAGCNFGYGPNRVGAKIRNNAPATATTTA